MPQAKRTTRKRSAPPRRGLSHGFGVLIVGIDNRFTGNHSLAGNADWLIVEQEAVSAR